MGQGQNNYSTTFVAVMLKNLSAVGRISISAIAFLALLFVSGCKPTLDLSQRKPKLQPKEARLLYRKLGQKSDQFQWLSGKVEVKSLFKGDENEFSTTLKIRKDSLLWLSISALSLEVARINLTTDSVMFLNRLNKSYYTGTFDYLQKSLHIEDVDFCFVQNILLGQPVLLNDDERWIGEIDSAFYVLKNVPGKKLRKALGITKDEDFDQPADSLYLYDTVDRKLEKVIRKNKENDHFLKRYFVDENFNLVKMLLTDVPNNRILEINYDDFQSVDNLLLPHRINVNISDISQHTRFEMAFTRYKTETPTSVSFKIPEKYAPVKP